MGDYELLWGEKKEKERRKSLSAYVCFVKQPNKQQLIFGIAN